MMFTAVLHLLLSWQLPQLLLQAGAGGRQDYGSSLIFLIGGTFLIMYFFMYKPQQKKAKQQDVFVDSLAKGNKVVTIGGIHGKIDKIDGNTVLLEIAPNTKIRVEKSTISAHYTQVKDEPAAKK